MSKILILRVPLLGVAVSALLAACSSQPEAKAPDPQATATLKDSVKRRDALQASFDATPKERRRTCELKAGDCRLEVTDARDKILRSHSTPVCRGEPDSPREFACVAKHLEATGHAEVVASYYKQESFCLEKLVECTERLEGDAVASAQKARYEERKATIDASRQGSLWRALPAFASEKVTYLRAILPPQAEGSCTDEAALKRCLDGTKSSESAFETELGKVEASYNQDQAKKLYEASQNAKAQCYESEYTCLVSRLDAFGGTAETRAQIKTTLGSLKRRQQLVSQLGDEGAEACLTAGVEKHQGRIVGDYKKFAREPVLFFQSQLHKDFRQMYDTQSRCLESTSRGSSVATTDQKPGKHSAAN